jgi:hypothetical protein
MNAFSRKIVRAISIPIFGSLRYAVAMALLCLIWVNDARLLNGAFDLNLAIIKYIAGLTDGSGRVEAALRGFSADRMLLFTEASILVWITGKILWWPFGLLFAWRSRRRTEAQRPKTTTRPSAPRLSTSSTSRPNTPRPNPEVATGERR